MSGNSWANMGQECIKCHINVYPHKQAGQGREQAGCREQAGAGEGRVQGAGGGQVRGGVQGECSEWEEEQ